MGNVTNLPATTVVQRQGMALMAPEQDIFAWAQAMIQHKLVPEGLDTPEKVILCACAGREFGISPFQAVNDFYVVKGRIGVMTQLMVSRLRGAGHRLTFDEQSMEKATVTITRRDGQSNTVSVTWADAEAAGWHKTPNGLKPTWAGQGRKTMLTYRAASINIRQFCPEVLRRSTGEVMATADEIADDGRSQEDTAVLEATLRDRDLLILHLKARVQELEAELRDYEDDGTGDSAPRAAGTGDKSPAEFSAAKKHVVTLGELPEDKRAEFLSKGCAYYGITAAQALEALGVKDLAQVDVSPLAAKERISAWVEAKAAEKAKGEPETADSATPVATALAGTEPLWPRE